MNSFRADNPIHTESENTYARQGATLSIQTDPAEALLAPGKGDLNVSLANNPLGDIVDNYASDPESLVHPLEITGPLPAQAIFQDEDSRDSTESFGNASSASLSPRSNTMANKIAATVCKKITGVASGAALDYLASTIERRDVEIANLIFQKKSQEGKTAAQTRKVNLAIQGETKALEESAASKAEADRERKLREKEAAEKSTLLIAHAGLSIAAGNHSTGDKVSGFCQFNRSLDSDCEQIPLDRGLAIKKRIFSPQRIFLASRPQAPQVHP